jgi:hypothetical protein
MNKKLVFIISGILVGIVAGLLIYIYLSTLMPENTSGTGPAKNTELPENYTSPTDLSTIAQSAPQTNTLESGVSADQLTPKINAWKKEFPDLFKQYPDLEKMLKGSKGQLTSQIIKTLASYSAAKTPATATAEPPSEPDKKDPAAAARDSKITDAIIALSDPNPKERIAALQTLIDLKAKETIPNVTRLLYDQDNSVRIGTLYCLRLLGAKEAIPEIMRLLYDADAAIRKEAIYALGELQAKEAIASIRYLSSDPNEQVRTAAEETARRLEAK